MKGLLVKDFRFIFKSRRMALGVLGIALFLLFIQGVENYVFIISYVTMVAGMLVLGTISSDEYDKSNAFLMTMPIDRSIYAREKYVFSLGCSLAGWLLATALCMALNLGQGMEVLAQAAAVFLLMSLLQFAILPVQLKFGGENGRIVLIGIIAALLAVAVLCKKIADAMFPGAGAEELLARAQRWLEAQNGWALGFLACIGWLAGLCISLAVSLHIMQAKEF